MSVIHRAMQGVLLGALLAAMALPAFAEEASRSAPAWTVTCVSAARSGPADCKMEQRLVAQETGQTLSLVVIKVPGDTREPVMQVLLPNGLALSEAVTLQVDDGKAAPLPLAFCDASGCLASMPLSSMWLKRLQKGKTLTFKATTAQGDPLQLNHSLADFTSSFGTVK